MATIVHGFDWPDRVVIGAVGQPGSRTFYLQVRTGRRLVSVALEKEQSALLAEKVDEILDGLMEGDANGLTIPATTPDELVDDDPLDPVDEQFRTGVLSLGWDPSTAQVVIEAYPVTDSDDDVDEDAAAEPAEMLQVRMPVGAARAFARRTRGVVDSGRPRCPVCGAPIDDGGHVCQSPDTL